MYICDKNKYLISDANKDLVQFQSNEEKNAYQINYFKILVINILNSNARFYTVMHILSRDTIYLI